MYSLFILFATSIPQISAQSKFNLTALSAFNGASRLECWALDSIPKLGRGAANYDIGNFSNAFIGVLPPRTYASSTISHAPVVQFSIFLSGLAHIRIPNSTLPASESEAWIQGGKYGFLIAADTLDRAPRAGHVTEFPGSDETVILQFPTEGNKIPSHELLHTGPCRLDELVGL
ncbi:hypothetical protein BU16DRAFT_454117 [Lophium mytilinum]|uniref:Small secreted protein n=1 Tax=Lophium mytilinum TaxID=390894 RepID=A0A6A6R5I2_9PEZI|nr:hypothetical protein BU16DRAFT_454117 [Lophium mytilinum]